MNWRNKYILRGEIVDASHEAQVYGILILSLVRTNKSNTCFYRALCYLCDAQARLLTLSSPFEYRFSSKRIVRLERKWLSVRLLPHRRSKVEDCLEYFKVHNLPTEPENGAMQFKIESYVERPNNGAEIIRSVKRIVRKFGPVIGGLKLHYDYFDGDDEVYLAEDEEISWDNLGNVRRPPRVESPVRRTPTPPPLTPSPPMQEEEQPEEVQQQQEEGIPRQRKYPNAHAVCIVGDRIAKDRNGVDQDCFIVQDSFGSMFRDGGFSLIPVGLFTKFFFVKLQKQ